MLAIKQAGGMTVAQNQESCVVFGMPGAAMGARRWTTSSTATSWPRALLRLARGEPLAAGR